MATSNINDNSDSDSVVPEVVIQRLPLYVRVLTQYSSAGNEVISSEQLGSQLQMTPAQIRKDLSYFGRFGKQGRGYDVAMLEAQLRTILGLDRTWNAAVIGMGRLGEHESEHLLFAILVPEEPLLQRRSKFAPERRVLLALIVFETGQAVENFLHEEGTHRADLAVLLQHFA